MRLAHFVLAITAVTSGACALVVDARGLTGGDAGARGTDASIKTGIDGSAETSSVGLAPADGLLAYWPLDEGGGTIANDASGNGQDATIAGAGWTTGHRSQALQFDGVNDYATATLAAGLGGKYTVALWVKLDVVPTVESRLLEVPNGTLTLRVDQNASWSFHWNDSSTTTASLSDATRLAQAGVWHHLAGTHDGSVERLYVDGEMRATKTGPSKIYGTITAGLGGDGRSPGVYTASAIDDVRIYTRALSDAEVQLLL